MLIIGMGRSGRRVADSVSALLKAEVETQAFVGPLSRGDGNVSQGSGIFGLPLEEARTILSNGHGWKKYLKWLPTSQDYQVWDELLALSAGGQRWLGRMAFIAGVAGVKEVLQSRLEILERKGKQEFEEVILVASLGGGTGSGLLADMTYLVRRLSTNSPRLAYLLLPGGESSEASRLQANAYAALKELFHLKYQTVPFEAEYPGFGSLVIPAGGAEPWQRLCLFAPKSDERPPYTATLDRMASAIAVHARSGLWRAALEEAHREVDLTLRGIPREARQQACFSSCGFSGDGGGDRGIPNPAEDGGLAAANAFSAGFTSGTAEEQERNNGLRELHIRRPAREAAAQFIDDLRRRIKSLEGKCENERGNVLTEMLQDVEAVAESLEPLLSNTEVSDRSGFTLSNLSLVSWLKRLFLWRKPKESARERKGLNSLPEYAQAAEKIRAGLLEYGLSAQREGVVRTLVFPEATMSSFEPGAEDRAKLSRETVELRKLVARGSRAFSRQTLKSICSVLDGVLENPEFAFRIKKFFVAQAEASLEKGDPRNAGTAGGEAPVPEGGSALPSEELVLSTPCLPGDWEERVRTVVRALEANVFSSTQEQSERRVIAIAAVPEAWLRSGKCQEVEHGLRRSLAERFSTASVQFRMVSSIDGQLAVYFEDLFRSPCEIVNIQALKKAYLNAERREMLHIDFRWLQDPRFRELCDSGSELQTFRCGNPGCEHDLSEGPSFPSICDGCGEPVVSRCGNPECKARGLHARPDGAERSCPECGGFNHSAWWVCCKHGKVPVWVPIDKKICPRCVERHHADPLAFPSDEVGRRPFDQGIFECPGCTYRRKNENANCKVYRIPSELVEFVKNGVNGHDRRRWAVAAKAHKWPHQVCCPECRQILIPIAPPYPRSDDETEFPPRFRVDG